MTRPTPGPNSRRAVASFLVAVAILSFPARLCAQETNAAATSGLTEESIQARIQRAQDSTLPDDAKAAVVDAYAQALDFTRTTAQWGTIETDFKERIETIPTLETEARAELDKLAVNPADEIPADFDAAVLSSLVAEDEQRLAELRQDLADREAEIQRRGPRRQELPGLISAARARLQEVASQPPVQPGSADAPELTEARGILAQARLETFTAEVVALETEQRSHEFSASRNMLFLLRDRGVKRVQLAEASLKAFQARLTQVTEIEARDAEGRARETLMAALEEANPAVRRFVEEVGTERAAFAARRTGPDGLPRLLERASADQLRIDETRTALDAAMTAIREKVQAAGLTGAVGVLLRKKRSELPDARALARDIDDRARTISRYELELIDLRSQRTALADPSGVVDAELALLLGQFDDEEWGRLRELMLGLVQSKREALDLLMGEMDRYLTALINVNVSSQDLLTLTRASQDFIDENVLWIQSGPPLSLATLRDAAGPAWFISNPDNWRSAATDLWSLVRRRPATYALPVALFLAIAATRPRLRKQLHAIAKEAERPSCTNFSLTARAFVLTTVLSAVFAAAVAGLGWCLTLTSDTSEFGRAAGSGALLAGLVILSISLPRQVFRVHGLAEAHYAWPPAPLQRLRRILAWTALVVVPCAFVLGAMDWQSDESWNESLGRIVFLVLMAALVIAMHVAGRPGKSPIAALVAARGVKPHAWALRLGHGLATMVPAALFVMALVGYQYTALRLSWRLYVTLCLTLVLALAHAMIMRWLLITRRRLALEQSRRKRDAVAVKALSEDGPTPIIEEPSLDFAAISVQSSRAVRGVVVVAGILAAWFIWKDVLPALRVFERYEVWNIQTTDESGKTVLTPITLANVALAMLLAAIAFVATRNLPGVLEILVLQRMKLASGERHAITTIVRYVLVAAGAIASFSALGIGWAKVQWLVAALSLGLGFGLQEIFANFVSGIILLFEQPVRVGDLVTIGDKSGIVTRIRIRATTIRDWDFKELIVPNRELVTGQLVNWTLTDSTNRVVVPVGIAYGSDLEKACKILGDIAASNDLVIGDPAPQILFMGFGDSSLNFELRVYCGSWEDNLPTRHTLHLAIDKAFREAGIEIAFPQLDVRIRETDPTSASRKSSPVH